MSATVGLYIIARDEAEHLPRLLENITGAFDQVVLVDTGSTDDTLDIFDGWLHDNAQMGDWSEFEWTGSFSDARNEALGQLSTDWCVWMDADDTCSDPRALVALLRGAHPEVDAAAFSFPNHWLGGTTGSRVRATRRGAAMWRGSRHESLDTGEQWTAALRSVSFTEHRAGGRYLEDDLRALHAEFEADSTNARAAFYLAQTCRDLGATEQARSTYDKRVALGGWAEEVYVAMVEAALLAHDWLPRLTAALDFRPSRPEAYYHLARLLRETGKPRAGYLFAAAGVDLPRSTDALFVQTWMHEWGLEFEEATSAYYANCPAACARLTQYLLVGGQLPEAFEKAARRNLELCRAAG